MKELKEALKSASRDLFKIDIEPELSRPDEKFGDYSTNLAMQLGKRLGKNPKQIVVALAGKLHGHEGVGDVSIAGPGFINIKLTDEKLAGAARKATELPKPLAGQEILVEFGDPNPFKEMHIGHLYSYIVGDCLSRLLEARGATVRRLSYHGDVGLQVAQAVYGMLELGEQSNLGGSYAYGAEKYASIASAKDRIEAINKAIYTGNDPEIKSLHEKGVKQSFKEFDQILNKLSIKTDKRYLESDSTNVGLHLVKANTGKVFKESKGAVIYEGEKAGLHTRVFITSKGLPTYEAKDLGLAELKNKDYPKATKSIIITANEQSEYFKVMLAALKEIEEPLAKKTTHLTHGFVTLSTGKMSSRTGEVYSAVSLISDVEREAKKLYPNSEKHTHLAAIKYGFLKHRLGGDIVYDLKESVSLEGNSGPYLQYAFARAQSVLRKSKVKNPKPDSSDLQLSTFDPLERSLARKIGEYPEVVERATEEFLPSHITTYLYELAQSFNRFYEKSRVIGDKRGAVRLKLVEAYADVLKSGLELLNIEASDKI